MQLVIQEEPNMRLEFYLRDDTDGRRAPWNFLDEVSKNFLEVVKVALKRVITKQLFIGLGFRLICNEGR